MIQMCDHTVCNTDVVLLKSLKKNHQKDQSGKKQKNKNKKEEKSHLVFKAVALCKTKFRGLYLTNPPTHTHIYTPKGALCK